MLSEMSVLIAMDKAKDGYAAGRCHFELLKEMKLKEMNQGQISFQDDKHHHF